VGRQPGAVSELLDVDVLIDDDSRAIRDTIRRFVDERVRPSLSQWYESAVVPVRELARELGALGALGMHLQGYGCAGTSATAYGLACMELEAGDSGLRSLVSVQGSLAMYAIWRYGTEEQKNEWLPRMARGEAIGCFGLTEADFGSNPGGMRTYARRDGADWIVHGSIADVAVIWAQSDQGILGFLVPTITPGFTTQQIEHKLSLRASVTSELVLNEVRLPGSALLPGASGLSGPLACLNEARFGITFGALGAARDCLESTIAYCRTRMLFDKPLAAYQLTQAKLADMSIELGKGMLLALHLGRLKDAGSLRDEHVSVGKLNSVREAIAIARECRTLLGAAGITLDYPAMRHASNLESVLTYEGTSEVHQLIVGRAITGQAAFR
jgi:glutaryl-CoA dehydrogenase